MVALRAPIRVALLNDYPLVVEGLDVMLRPYRDRVVVVDTSTEGAIDAPVDIALYDTYGVTRNDVHWSEHLANGCVPRYVVLYSWQTSPVRTRDADRHAATIQVPKALDGETLVDVLEQIHATGSYQLRYHGSPSPDGGVARLERWPGQKEGLTQRESEVLALIVTGMSNEELAKQLFIGVNTVKTYIRSGYRTMGVTDRANAILWGIDHGFRPQRPSS